MIARRAGGLYPPGSDGDRPGWRVVDARQPGRTFYQATKESVMLRKNTNKPTPPPTPLCVGAADVFINDWDVVHVGRVYRTTDDVVQTHPEYFAPLEADGLVIGAASVALNDADTVVAGCVYRVDEPLVETFPSYFRPVEPGDRLPNGWTP